MAKTESDHLHQLLTSFDAHALGEGDLAAGVNVLAAMAITLANLARSGSGIRTPDLKLIPLGCNVLSSGSLTSNMVLDEVVTPVGQCQDNLLSNLERLLKVNEKEEKRKDRNLPRRWFLADEPSANPSENSLLRLMTGDPELEMLIGSREGEWAEVLGSSPSEHLDDLVRHPRIFIAGASPAFLDKQLPGAHHGRPLVAIGLNRASDVARFGNICPALMDGMIPAGPAGELVRGRLLMTDSGGVLNMAAQADGDKTAWLARLLWLVDGNAGPEPPARDKSDQTEPLTNLNVRFNHAVQMILANRLNSLKPKPLIYECDFAQTQARWMKFLADMERSLPGIRGTARGLLVSLFFGLQQLVNVRKSPEDFVYSYSGIASLARHLIRRMANARAAILSSTKKAGKWRDKRKILNRLADGPLDARSIYRPLHLPADDCKEMLTELVEEGCVKPRGKKWERIKGATLPEDDLPHLPLEVS